MNSERRNITQPADWWAAFEVESKKEGVSLAEWVGACCVANLPVSVSRALSERPTVGAPKLAKDEGR